MAASNLQSPPVRYQPSDKSGYCNRIWSRWFLGLFTKLGGSDNLGNFYLQAEYPLTLPGNPGIIYIPVPCQCTLIRVDVANQVTMTGAPEIVNILDSVGATISQVFLNSGALAGTVATANIAPNAGLGNDYSPGQTVGLHPQGVSSTACEGSFVLTFSY